MRTVRSKPWDDVSPGEAPPITWEAELFVLRGDDRAQLLTRVQDLRGFLDQHADVAVTDLAFSLDTSLAAGGQRLALVAGSVKDLQTRLERAAERLADPACHQIKDVSGIYYFQEPLHAAGKLALLFPGEGAQYPNMLGDLMWFPEVRAMLKHCDEVASRSEFHSGDQGSKHFSRVLFLPANATVEERARAEKDLFYLGNAIGGVLVADIAISQVLGKLGIQPDAVAGHSMGELAALSVAGCINVTSDLLEKVVSVVDTLQQQELQEDGSAAVLLAVGAGGQAVADIVRNYDDVYLAMENCPHQTVVVGPAQAMAGVEKEFQARRWLCERLPFRRPYHTPLFAPHLVHLEKMFDQESFLTPATQVYSCTTCELFPDDPDEIRRLTVAHWATPMPFIRLIERMYADGIRIFVECGPRGILTGFVEDILRGRTFTVIPANIQRRSGLTQLLHLVGQLAAHHVPVNLEYLFQDRAARRVSWAEAEAGGQRSGVRGQKSAVSGQLQESAPPGILNGSGDFDFGKDKQGSGDERTPPSAPLSPLGRGAGGEGPARAGIGSARDAVLQQYLQVMDQFLDLQQEITQRFLAASRSAPASNSAAAVNGHVPLPTSAPVQPAGPMLGDVLRHEPGKLLVMRRRLDLAEDLFAAQHTVGGRTVSKIDPEQHGLPVMPMTFSLEMMAEVSSFLVPGKVAIAFENIRLHRWLAFDAEEPTTVEVTARVLTDTPGSRTDWQSVPQGQEIRVEVEVVDQGNSIRPGNEKPAAQGVAVLADRYPEAPQASPFTLAGERPQDITLEFLYKNLFHGPLFQGICAQGTMADDGVETDIVVLPREQLFRSHKEPQFLLDPVLLDVAMHPLAIWHLEQADQTGRIVLPFQLEKLEVFGPKLPVGTKLRSRGWLVDCSAKHFTHGVEAFLPDGRLWYRMTGVRYWRFYLPFGEYNFHGPKDAYFLSTAWRNKTGAAKLFPLDVPYAVIRLEPPGNLLQASMRDVTGHITLSPREFRQFRRLKGNAQRHNEWLFGRIAAKDALRVLWWEEKGQRLFPADIEIDPDAHGRPIARPRFEGDRAAAEGTFPAISISHSGGLAVGMAAMGERVGIDVEKIQPRSADFENIAFTAEEKKLLERFGGERDEAIARLWCAKEAASKALGRGLVEGAGSLIVRAADADSGRILLALGPVLAKTLQDFAGDLLVVWTVRDQDWVLAATVCDRVKT